MQHHGTIETLEWVTPHLARLALAGDGLANFEPPPDASDGYINVAIPPADAPYQAPFEIAGLKHLANELRPYRRRYTIRRWDPAQRVLTVDFVVHGDTGIAGPWAAQAKPGDALVFSGPAGGYAPDPDADWHLLVGDESALPAIGASLELIPTGAPTVVRLLCDGPEYEVALDCAGRLDLVWLHRSGAADDDQLLPRAVADMTAPPGRAHAFIHGEAGETRAVRRHVLAERGFAPDQLSCSPYWRRGYDDEAWRQIKAAWVADVERDVPDY